MLDGESEFVVQRYIESPHGKASKVRVKWSSQGLSFRKICRKTSYPFNSSLVSVAKPRIATRRGSFAGSEAGSTQQLRFPMLLPSTYTPPTHKHSSSFSRLSTSSVNFSRLSTSSVNSYTVSFRSGFDAVEDSRLGFGLESFAQEVVNAFKAGNTLQGRTLTELEFDVMQGCEGQWYFLDVKDIATESIESRVQQKLEALGYQTNTAEEGATALCRTLSKLQAFFHSNQSLIKHKSPFLPRQSFLHT